jgi:opacity protein-like surface antigen
MKLASSIVLAATLLAPAIAAAQPSQSPPPPPPPPGYGGGYYAAPPATAPGGFMNRGGRLAIGVGLGFGGMSADEADLSCQTCEGGTVAAGIDFHIGGMLSPRLALLAEFQVNAQPLEEDVYGDTVMLTQAALLGAAQFWVTPRLWVKGGLGFASLQESYSNCDDYYDDCDQELDTGGALLLGAGVELVQSRNFALDLQGRILAAGYEDLDDTITSATIGVGLNWY